jgi:adenosylhomocysteine nucleosidase
LPLYLDKTSAWARTQCVAADMESAAVAAVARRNGLPFIALRAVADPVDFSLPQAALVSMGKDGRLKPWKLALSLWRQPGQIRPLRELAGHSAAAKEALRKAARAAGADFALPLARLPLRDTTNHLPQ